MVVIILDDWPPNASRHISSKPAFAGIITLVRHLIVCRHRLPYTDIDETLSSRSRYETCRFASLRGPWRGFPTRDLRALTVGKASGSHCPGDMWTSEDSDEDPG
jgi:hypothetical protein